jgi:hypothetical protein
MRNLGALDRGLRLAAAIVILAAVGLSLAGGPPALILGGIAIVLIATSLLSTCPAYLPFGISTRGHRS